MTSSLHTARHTTCTRSNSIFKNSSRKKKRAESIAKLTCAWDVGNALRRLRLQIYAITEPSIGFKIHAVAPESFYSECYSLFCNKYYCLICLLKKKPSILWNERHLHVKKRNTILFDFKRAFKTFFSIIYT